MNKIQYQIKLWGLRGELQDMGIYKPVNELIKRGKITPDKKFSNLLLGRTEDKKFLKLLEWLRDSEKNA